MSFGKIAVLVVFGAAGYFTYSFFTEPERIRTAFGPKLAEYIAVAYEPGEESVAEGERPYRSGKVLVIRPGQGSEIVQGSYVPPSVDMSFYQIPSAIRAANPDEVSTLIVAIKGAKLTESDTTPPEPGTTKVIFVWKSKGVNIVVYDLKRRIRVGTDFIHGGADGDYSTALARYVESMPVR